MTPQSQPQPWTWSPRVREELEAELVVLAVWRQQLNDACDKRAEAIRALLGEAGEGSR